MKKRDTPLIFNSTVFNIRAKKPQPQPLEDACGGADGADLRWVEITLPGPQDPK
jgi:hypothetical protein